MSSECERAFSQAKKLITVERHSLLPDIIEADQCVKSWLRNGLVDGGACWQRLDGLLAEERAQMIAAAKAAAAAAAAAQPVIIDD
jgi:hypothetical protein